MSKEYATSALKLKRAAFAAMLALPIVFGTCGALAQDVKGQADEKQLLNEALEKTGAGGCPGGVVVVSVNGSDHRSSGSPKLLFYNNTVTDEGGAWYSDALFIAPCNGVYFFSVSFMKEPYGDLGSGLVWTDVDVYICLHRNGQPIGSYACAWSGENKGDRNGGSYNVALRLPGGKVATLRKLVVANEVGIGLLRPASGRLVQLVGEGARDHRNFHALRREESELVFPVETRR